MQRTTMREVAAAAGVSLATVSRVLSNHPSVNPDKRERVRNAAAKLRYSADPALRMIAASRWRAERRAPGQVIAWLTFGSPRMSRFAAAVAEDEGYRLDPIAIDPADDGSRVARVLQHRGIQGLLLVNNEHARTLPAFPWERFCSFGIHEAFGDNPVDCARFNPFDSLRELLLRGVSAGHRRIGVVLLRSARGLTRLNEKLLGAVEVTRQSGTNRPRVEVLWLVSDDSAAEQAERIRGWFARHRFSLLVAHLPAVATWIRLAGIQYPGDCAVLALRGANSQAGLAGLAQDSRASEAVAVRQVVLRLRHNLRGQGEHSFTAVIPPRWTPGPSFPEPAVSPAAAPRGSSATAARRGRASSR